MARFRVVARHVLGSEEATSGHVWMAFHRCVEAMSRLSGETFTALFARLGAAHGFRRQPPPPVAPLQAAVRDLIGERAALLTARAQFIAQRRREKAAGRRQARAEALDALEARHRQLTAQQPLVGYWGWAKRR